MPKLRADTQRARREHILNAAEICIARSGFHGCSIQDICREAAVSPGALYVYFASKEALIAGIAERDRTKLAAELDDVARAPDLLAALTRLGEHYTVEEPEHKRKLFIEIGAEATRNPVVGEIFRSVDGYCLDSFERLFARAKAEGKIDPAHDAATLARLIAIIGDGLFWRRAVDPKFDVKALLPAITKLVGTLLNPAEPGKPYNKSTERSEARQ